MKKLLTRLFIVTLIFVLHSLSYAQTYQWAKSMGGNSDDNGRSIIIDASGNIYTTGSFQGIVDFDPGSGTANLTSKGSSDIFVCKLGANGNFLWAKSMGGLSSDAGYSVTIDGFGNIYTTGVFQDTVDFNPSNGTSNLTSEGIYDVFICKLDASGNFVWAKSIGGVSSDDGRSITTDASGNVYIAGLFSGTCDFDPGNGTSNLISLGWQDIFICKLDANGNFLWAKSMGETGSDFGYSITTDASGNIYTTGSFRGTVDFDPGSGTSNLISAGNSDVFICKLDANGNFVWAKSMGGSTSDQGYSITTDASGNVYTTGGFQGTADFDPGLGTINLLSAGNYDIFICKLNNNGNFLWAKSMGGSSDDYSQSITTDVSGNIYTTGVFQSTVDFNPGSGTNNLTSTGYSDIFICKLNSNGNFLWAKSMGGSSDDNGRSITIDTSGNIYTTGHYKGTADFDPSSGTANLTSAGQQDIFICKFSQLSTEVPENSFTNSLKIFPNPNNGVFTLKAENEGVYSILNELGQTIQQVKLNSTNDYTMNIENLSMGIYFVMGYNNEQMTSQKIIVTR